MKPEIKERWLQALRSGDYRQGTGCLSRVGGTFCCLGVLCDLATKDGIVKWDGVHSDGSLKEHRICRSTDVRQSVDSSTGDLPRRVQQWAELECSNPDVAYKGGYEGLADLNDEVGLDFKAIADLIEQSL